MLNYYKCESNKIYSSNRNGLKIAKLKLSTQLNCSLEKKTFYTFYVNNDLKTSVLEGNIYLSLSLNRSNQPFPAVTIRTS